MIIGIGIDLIEIARITTAIGNERFRQRVFTNSELTESGQKAHRLAGFFAAKEALLKAMGTGLSSFSWHEIEVGHDTKGAPYLQVSGKAQVYLGELKVSRIHLSISHCREYAVAQVVLEEL